MSKKYPPPQIEFINEKDPSGDGTWMVGIVMTDIPNKKLANMSLNWMKEAMNDQIVKLMGKVAMQELDEKRQKEKAQ